MIKIGNKIIEQGQFGDGTLKCEVPVVACTQSSIHVTWCYDNDSELFTLWCLIKSIKEINPNIHINMSIPYIPHARQDRNVSGRLFTLKYFSQILNQIDANVIWCLDPHSDVTTALIDKIKVSSDLFFARCDIPEGSVFMYPDAGAAKKYSDSHSDTAIIGFKKRDYSGRIASYDLLNFKEGTKCVVIRDDICSYGGTFVAAAKELRARGVEKIYLIVSHCENNIANGEVFNYIDKVYTTDSICTIKHPQLEIMKSYREELINE